MNPFGRVSAVLLVLGSLLCGGEVASAAGVVRTFKLVELSGTPYQRGLQHGKLLHDSIHKAVAVWKENLEGTFHTDSDLFIKKFAMATNYVSSIEKWTPDLLQEVHGIADGAGIDFQTMLVFQLPDEYWVNGSSVAEHCSALGISATRDHSAFVAQNMDLEGFRDGGAVRCQVSAVFAISFRDIRRSIRIFEGWAMGCLYELPGRNAVAQQS